MDKIQVVKPFLPPFEEYLEVIEKIWNTEWLTNNGPLHKSFQKKLKEYLRVKNLTLFVNGHLSIEIALKSLNLAAGGEVITTPFTFASTTHAIVNSGLKPVFADININDFTIDVKKIEDLITEKTVAILPVHIFGYPADVYSIDKIAEKYNLKVIYDAAHAFGVELNGKSIANFGDVSMFSMHATKVFHSIEGGFLVYGNDNLEYRLEMYKNFGLNGNENVDLVGINAKMNEFQAAMGLVNLKYIDLQISKRGKLVNFYREMLKDIDGIRFLEDINGLRHNYSYFPIIIDEKITKFTRDELYEELRKNNIFARKYFYPLVSDFNCYKDVFKNEKLSIAKYVSDRVLTLPLYYSLTFEQITYITEKIKDFYAK